MLTEYKRCIAPCAVGLQPGGDSYGQRVPGTGGSQLQARRHAVHLNVRGGGGGLQFRGTRNGVGKVESQLLARRHAVQLHVSRDLIRHSSMFCGWVAWVGGWTSWSAAGLMASVWTLFHSVTSRGCILQAEVWRQGATNEEIVPTIAMAKPRPECFWYGATSNRSYCKARTHGCSWRLPIGPFLKPSISFSNRFEQLKKASGTERSMSD